MSTREERDAELVEQHRSQSKFWTPNQLRAWRRAWAENAPANDVEDLVEASWDSVNASLANGEAEIAGGTPFTTLDQALGKPTNRSAA